MPESGREPRSQPDYPRAEKRLLLYEELQGRTSLADAETSNSLVAYYLSMGHRALRGDGCPIVALGSDAARQNGDVKAAFQAGIEKYLELLGGWIDDAGNAQSSGKAMAILSTMIGAMVLSRAVNDEQMSRRFLEAAAESRALLNRTCAAAWTAPMTLSSAEARSPK